MKIYFKNPDTSSLYKLLHSAIDWNSLDHRILFKETFSDPEFKVKECHSARRSFHDIVIICNTYIRCTKKEVAKTLSNLPNICCYRCAMIDKYVFHINPMAENCFKDSHPKGEETVDSFSFEDFETLLYK